MRFQHFFTGGHMTDEIFSTNTSVNSELFCDISGDKKRVPYSILFSPYERRQAEKLGALVDLSTPAWIRLASTNRDIEAALLSIKQQHHDKRDGAKLLAVLGSSRMASNLNVIAKAINTGTFVFTPDTERHIKETYDIHLWMREALMRQQGLRQ